MPFQPYEARGVWHTSFDQRGPLRRYLAEWDFKWNTRKMTDGNVGRRLSKAQRASVSRIVSLVKPRTLKQKARAFLRWRKKHV
jgi:hypothetical protein